MTTTAARYTNHLPSFWANQNLPPYAVDTKCGLKRYDGKRTDLDVVHSGEPLTCEGCKATLSGWELLWENYFRTPFERCHLCGSVSADDPCRECDREIIDELVVAELADEAKATILLSSGIVESDQGGTS